jgi:hypothetical protein
MSRIPGIQINPGTPVVFAPNAAVGQSGDNAFWFNNTNESCQIVQLVNGQPSLEVPLTDPILPNQPSNDIALAVGEFTYGAMIEISPGIFQWDNSQGSFTINAQT